MCSNDGRCTGLPPYRASLSQSTNLCALFRCSPNLRLCTFLQSSTSLTPQNIQLQRQPVAATLDDQPPNKPIYQEEFLNEHISFCGLLENMASFVGFSSPSSSSSFCRIRSFNHELWIDLFCRPAGSSQTRWDFLLQGSKDGTTAKESEIFEFLRPYPPGVVGRCYN